MDFFIWFVTIVQWDGVWSMRASVSVPRCFRHVGTGVQLLSPLIVSVCFRWHKCIVKRHTYLWGADKQPNTNTVFCSGYQGRTIVVILNTTRGTWHWKAHYMRMTRDNCLFQCDCLSLAISSLPLNLKWGTGRRYSYTIFMQSLYFYNLSETMPKS